jgi:hypothetical protein
LVELLVQAFEVGHRFRLYRGSDAVAHEVDRRPFSFFLFHLVLSDQHVFNGLGHFVAVDLKLLANGLPFFFLFSEDSLITGLEGRLGHGVSLKPELLRLEPAMGRTLALGEVKGVHRLHTVFMLDLVVPHLPFALLLVGHVLVYVRSFAAFGDWLVLEFEGLGLGRRGSGFCALLVEFEGHWDCYVLV